MAATGIQQDVLDEAGVDTALLIVDMQIEDATVLGATGLLQELARRRVELRNRQLGEQLERENNDGEEVFEVAAFGWKLKQWNGQIEVCENLQHARSPCNHSYLDF